MRCTTTIEFAVGETGVRIAKGERVSPELAALVPDALRVHLEDDRPEDALPAEPPALDPPADPAAYLEQVSALAEATTPTRRRKAD